MEVLPGEIVSEILGWLNLRDILRLTQTSTSGRDLVHRNLVKLNSDSYQEVDAKYLSRFKTLTRTGRLIRVVVGPCTIPALVNLIEANIVAGQFMGTGIDTLVVILQSLRLETKPKASFRIMVGDMYSPYPIIVQGRQFAHGRSVLDHETIKSEFPFLQFVGNPSISRNLRNLFNEAQLSADILEWSETGRVEHPQVVKILGLIPIELFEKYFGHLDRSDSQLWNITNAELRPMVQTFHEFDVPKLMSMERYREILPQLI